MSIAPREPKNLRLSLSLAGHEMALMAGPFVGEHLDYVRNHVAGPLDHDRVADADILARYFIHIVQRCAFDCYAADRHRHEACHGRQGAGPADLRLDVENAGGGLARFELVSNCPA